MPFGSFFKKMFKRTACEVAEKYGGEDAGDLVKEGFQHLNLGTEGQGSNEDQMVDGLMQVFTGKQQSGLSTLFGSLGGSLGGLKSLAESKGVDPSIIDGLLAMLGGGGGGAAAAAAGGGGASSGGFNMGSLIQAASSLTSQGGSNSSLGGFMQLLQGLTGGQGGSAGNVLTLIIGLAKSFFGMQSDKNPALKDWGKANPDGKADDEGLGNYGDHLIRDLIDPGKDKDKDLDDDDSKKHKKADDNDIKDWYDNHPEIGKIQKDIFDDIFDIKDDDEEDDAPLIPTPEGFEDDCSILDQAAILFLNTNILLELRKKWRFLFSTKTHGKEEFLSKIMYQGPTLLILKDTNGNTFGAFSSTSWGNTGSSGWTGNGDTFLFCIKPKMAIFYSTGKNENFMHLDESKGCLGLGGSIGHFALSIDAAELTSGTCDSSSKTFYLPKADIIPDSFELEHVEAWGLGSDVDQAQQKNALKIRKTNIEISRGGGGGGGNVDMNDLLGQIS